MDSIKNTVMSIYGRFISRAYDMGYQDAMKDRDKRTKQPEWKNMVDEWLNTHEPTVSHAELDPTQSGCKSHIKGI
jgi:hypothetical protein